MKLFRTNNIEIVEECQQFLADRTIGRAFVTACRPSVCLSSVVCDVLYSGETAGPICVKFSGKMWSDHGTTWLHFGSVRVNRAMPIYEKTAGPICMNAPQILRRSSAMGQYGRPSYSDSWASCSISMSQAFSGWHVVKILMSNIVNPIICCVNTCT